MKIALDPHPVRGFALLPHGQQAPGDHPAGDRLRLVHVSDTMDHHASHGLRFTTNPPGNAVRMHQQGWSRPPSWGWP